MLVGDYFPDIGGVASYVHSLLVSLVKQGFEVRLFQTRLGRDVDLHKIKIYRIHQSFMDKFKTLMRGLTYFSMVTVKFPFLFISPKSLLSLLMLTGRMHEIVLKFKPNIVHSNHLSLRSLAAIILGRKFGLPVIVTAHGYDTDIPFNIFEYYLRKHVVGYADKVIVLTEAKRILVTKLYGSDDKYIVIPNFVSCKDILDIDDATKLERYKSQAKQELGIPSKKLVLLYIGRIIKRKGIFDIIHAIDMIKRRNLELYRQLEIIFAGKGSDANELVKLIAELDIRNANYLGTVSGDEKRRLLKATDVLLLPTYWPETFPTVILEAYKYGIPVITYPFPGATELILNNETGIIVSIRNAFNLAYAIIEIVSDAHRLRRMGLNALTLVKGFCDETIIPEITKLFLSTITRRH